MPDIAPLLDRAATCRGIAALVAALDMIGAGDDHKFAQVVCDAELDVRALLRFALAKLSTE